MEATAVSSFAQVLLPEVREEARLTRRVLARVPFARPDWQPHPKSMPLGKLARHTADLLGWIKDTLETTEIDVAHFDEEPAEPLRSTDDLLAYFDARIQATETSLQTATEEDFAQNWVMRSGDEVLVSQPRAEVVRHLISHLAHHRGQLTVYLRLLDVPLPAIYGPSADEAY